MKIILIQARMGSNRFPGKVLAKLIDKPILEWVVDAARKVSNADKLVVITSTLAKDDEIANWCNEKDISVFRGDEQDVLGRFYEAAKEYQANVIVRLTADCPLLDPAIIEQVLAVVDGGQADYASNVLPPTWPDGLDCEAFTMKALEIAYRNAEKESDREHVTSYITNNQYLFKMINIPCPLHGISGYRLTIDVEEDLKYIEKLLKTLDKKISTWNLLGAYKIIDKCQKKVPKRNGSFEDSQLKEEVFCNNFNNSNDLLTRALKTIPLGSQTFSKAYTQYPLKNSPLFLTHGNGSRVWDVDGNEYIDLVSGLLPIILGYNDPDVNYEIQQQLHKGISFSLATELEIRLAEKLCNIIPSAQKVRFAKNGTDVTSAAIRLSRAYTSRSKVIVCGYHGWQDWYIGTTTRNKGVPKEICNLSTTVLYNDLDALESLLKTEEYACIILEVCNVESPNIGYLQTVKQLCEKFGTVLIFDEIITGFRFSVGGAQEYFGVTPHLSCFGKAMGNGMPISAIVGSDVIMKGMEEIFFSGTFGGETLSIAASLATIEKIENNKVIDYLWKYGGLLSRTLNEIISANNMNDYIKLVGLAPWKILKFSGSESFTALELQTLFVQEMIYRGILINSSFNINFAHKEFEKQKIVTSFHEVINLLSKYIQQGMINRKLKSPSIKPVFSVR